MKKLFILTLVSINLLQAQTILNGGFENYSTLPTCAGYDITQANNWNGIRTYYAQNNCLTSLSDVNGIPSNVDYFNQSVGGTTPWCQNSTLPRTGEGWAVCEAQSMLNAVPFLEFLYQPVNGVLTAGSQYVVKCYVNRFNAALATLSWFNASLVNQNVGASATSIVNDLRSQYGGVGPYTGIPYTSGWHLFQKTITVPATGNYYLVFGDMFFCNDFDANVVFRWAIDDASFSRIPCAAPFPTKVSQGLACCGGGWAPVQIGSPAVPGVTYNWTPSLPSLYVNGTNANSAQPYVDISSYGGCLQFCCTASGPHCDTTFQCVTVCTNTTPPQFSCCRLTSVDEVSGENIFSAFPNPASAELIIRLAANAEQVRIIDCQGKLVFEQENIKKSDLTIDVSTFKKGLYFLTVKTNTKYDTKKLVID
jgi:hypothetical protein